MPVQLPVRTRVASIASTDSHLYAITSHGRVLEWKDVDGQLQHQHQAPIPEPTPLGGALAQTRAASMAAGASHMLFVGTCHG